ncbi:MAG: TlpA family protein disulfide reductase [Agathobacter sp.]|nr:TlpA family protein disulfide reductase [Agathobacter sp.]
MKKLVVILLSSGLILGLTACGGSTGKNVAANTETTETQLDADDIQAQILELSNKENDIIAEHQDLWDTVFNNVDKEEAKNSTESNYGAFLETQLNKITDQFTDDELSLLNADIDEIKRIEDQLFDLADQMESVGNGSIDGGMSVAVDENGNIIEDASTTSTPFPAFAGKDLDGNDVDSSIFSQNTVTLVNFWFSGCSPCVEELPTLNELNEALKEKGGAVIGINTDTLDGNADMIDEAKKILEEQGAAYQNIYFDSDSDAGEYATSIMAFPTTVLVDSNGNIIGEPILGGINNEESLAEVQNRIDAICK